MFSQLAKFTTAYKIPIIIFWVAVAVVMVVLAPSLSKVGVTDDTLFLPGNSESVQARDLLKQKFNGTVAEPAGSALIVVYNPQGLSSNDMQAARDLHDWLLSSEAPSEIQQVVSVFDNESLRSTLVSQDQTALLINLYLTHSSSDTVSRQAVESIRSHIQNQPTASQIYLTGGAGTARDVLTSIKETVDRATLVTILLVIVLLLIIYRSPVAMLVPLITIGVSYLVSRGIAGYIAASGVNVSSLVDAYLVVTLFGIGTDYCLFMVSRFKEELGPGDGHSAVALSLKRIGPVILASATTVIVALLCLGISQFGLNRTAGYILAIGVAVTLLAGLTLTPALISFFGKILLWPGKLQPGSRLTGRFWQNLGQRITHHPVIMAVPIILVLILPFFALSKMNYSASLLNQMAPEVESVRGYDIFIDHFPAGELNPLNVVIQQPSGGLSETPSLQALGDISEALSGVEGVAGVRYYATPANELLQWAQEIRDIGTNLSPATLSRLSFYQTLGGSLQALGTQYPGVTQSQNFQGIIAVLQQLSAASGQLQSGNLSNLPIVISQIQQATSGIADRLTALAAEFNLQVSTDFSQWLKSNYFSTDGTLARLDVMLNSDPYSQESIATVGRVRKVAGEALQSSTALTGATYYIGGISAGQADILDTNATDFMRVLGLAIIGILLVTVILLRSFIAPLYMLATVLFNFGATLGIATWLFLDVLKQNSLIYMLPIMVFVILIAVGSDYNIFLVSRIREEAQTRSLKEAIRNSVSNTGGVITSCGIILAGTFGTLTTASLQMVFQVGAAIGIGVLIDTFLIRAVAIPCLAVIAGRWSWWPSRLSRKV